MPPPVETVRRARQLRRAITLPEVLLWQRLRKSPEGVKFRRQHPVGRYVLDFYCPQAKTGIEIDGAAHDMGGNPGRDAVRDAWLMERGVAVLRIAARDVLRDADAVAEAILCACVRRCTPPSFAARTPPPHCCATGRNEILPVAQQWGGGSPKG